MTSKLTIDKAGRVVIPKPLRDALGLVAGDSLVAETSGQEIRLRASHEGAAIGKERGFWVYRTGRPLKEGVVSDWLDRAREERLRHTLP